MKSWIHGVVKAHAPGSDLAVFALHPHVAAAEDGGGHGDKRGEHRQVDVEGVDEEEVPPAMKGPLQVNLQRQRHAGGEGGGSRRC